MKRLVEKIRNQKGAALVEFAIVLPLLLVLVFGMIEFSIMFYDKAVITNASREGARAGIVYDFPDRISTGDIETIVGNYCSGRLITFGSTNQETTTVSGPCTNAGDTITIVNAARQNIILISEKVLEFIFRWEGVLVFATILESNYLYPSSYNFCNRENLDVN